MKISAVLIGKNEEQMLPRVMNSLQGIDEIIYTDTGSQDKSVEIARQFTDKIFYFPWVDDFAAARNSAKSHATGDWILSIDCDEILHDLSSVREAVAIAEQQQVLAVDCKLIAEDNGQYFLFPRLFKNSPQVWWVGAIHNHLSVQGIHLGNVMITHSYSPAHRLDPDRSLRILKSEVSKHRGARELFYLAREYFYRKDYEKTVQLLGEYVQKSVFLAEKAEAFLTMAKAYWELRMANDARDACVQALIINPHFKEAVLFMATLAGDGRGNEDWQASADQWKKMAETADNRNVLFVRT